MNQRFCPNCGSVRVEPDNRHTNVLGEAIFNQNKWYCSECSYTGLMPETAGKTEEMEGIEFEPVEQEKIDTDAGKGLKKYYFYIVIPALILYIIYLKLV